MKDNANEAPCSTIFDGVGYAANLQRSIEYHCRGSAVPAALAKHCPYHAKMLNDHLPNAPGEGPGIPRKLNWAAWVGLAAANFVYQAITDCDWNTAVERTWFQGTAILVAWLLNRCVSNDNISGGR